VNSVIKNIIFWVVMVATALLLWAVVKSNTGEKPKDFSFTEFTDHVEKGEVKDVTVVGGAEVTGTLKKDNASFKTTIPGNFPDIYKALIDKGVTVHIKDNSGGAWMSWLSNGLPLIILLGFWIFFMRQMQSGGNKALSFGKSRARLLSTQQKKITFKDVAGVDEAKEELHEIIEFLREPKVPETGRPHPEGCSAGGPSRYR